MERYFYVLLLCAIIFFTTNCGSVNKTQNASLPLMDSISEWPIPSIPVNLETSLLKANYLVLHFWDGFSINTPLTHSALEQARVNYLSFLPYASTDIINKSFKSLFEVISTDKYHTANWISFFDDYLYNPDSPVKNDEIYILCIEMLFQQKLLDTTQNEMHRIRYDLVKKNRVGTTAADFKLYFNKEDSINLHDLPQTNYKLLFFNNPDCEDCMSVKQTIENENQWRQWVDEQKLSIVSVYTEGNMDLWQNTSYPSWWINVCDLQKIQSSSLYNIKTMPTIYLLDHTNTVILKDATIEQVYQYLIDVKEGRTYIYNRSLKQ